MVTPDLYKELGVGKRATRAEIRAAYRRKAKEAHPDTSDGSATKFAVVKRAHDVLTDEERRARYDATGDASEREPDNVASQAATILGTTLDYVLGEIDKRGGDPLTFDVIGDMRTLLGAKLDDLAQAKTKQEQLRKKHEKLLGKFKLKKGSNNILENVIRQKITTCESNIQNIEREIEPGNMAYDMLKLYSYEFKQQVQVGYAVGPVFNVGTFMAGF